jgi:hypothetical protein
MVHDEISEVNKNFVLVKRLYKKTLFFFCFVRSFFSFVSFQNRKEKVTIKEKYFNEKGKNEAISYSEQKVLS